MMDKTQTVQIAYQITEKAQDILNQVNELFDLIGTIENEEIMHACEFPNDRNYYISLFEVLSEKRTSIKKYEKYEIVEKHEYQIGDILKCLFEIDLTNKVITNKKKKYSFPYLLVADINQYDAVLINTESFGMKSLIKVSRKQLEECCTYMGPRPSSYERKTFNDKKEETEHIVFESLKETTLGEFAFYSVDKNFDFSEVEYINIWTSGGELISSLGVEATNNDFYGGFVRTYFPENFVAEDIQRIQIVIARNLDNRFVNFGRKDEKMFQFTKEGSNRVPRDMFTCRKSEALAGIIHVEHKH